MSKVRPEPAPTTWMIEAHSAFFSMSPTEAFWTFRILPPSGDDLADDGAGGGCAQHLLGLALELRLGQPDGDDRGETFEDVVLDDVGLVDLQLLGGAEHIVEGAGDGLLEPRDVRAALRGG